MTSELAGVPEEQVLRVEKTADPMRQAVFAFARKVSREPASIRREDVASLRPYLTDTEIVELVFAVCRYDTMNRLADAFGVPLEKENVFRPPPGGEGKGGETRRPGTERPQSSGQSAEPLRCVVSTVQGNVVSVPMGASDGVRVGDCFALSRGLRYVGRILVTDVEENQSTGRFDDSFAGSAAPPQVGDIATFEPQHPFAVRPESRQSPD